MHGDLLAELARVARPGRGGGRGCCCCRRRGSGSSSAGRRHGAVAGSVPPVAPHVKCQIQCRGPFLRSEGGGDSRRGCEANSEGRRGSFLFYPQVHGKEKDDERRASLFSITRQRNTALRTDNNNDRKSPPPLPSPRRQRRQHTGRSQRQQHARRRGLLSLHT